MYVGVCLSLRRLLGASLSEPNLNVENDMVICAQRSMSKKEFQHTIVVWYGGSCTDKYDKLTDISIQVLSNAKIFGFVY